MKSFIAKRIILGMLVLFGVVLITFVLTRVIPSNPAAQWVGHRATLEQIKAAEIELGLDKPLYVQLGKYLADLSRGDLGRSLRSHQPVSAELKAYLPATVELVLVSTIVAMFIGIPLGVASAKRKDQMVDHISRFFSVGAVSRLPLGGMFPQLILTDGWRFSSETSLARASLPDIPHYRVLV